MNRAGFAFWLSTMCAFTVCQAAPEDKNCLENSPRPMRAAARYTSPKGIGYQTGYTTLEGFFSSMFKDKWIPFVDLRGHVFDNGKLAANAGLGVRYLTPSRVWGINTYYDYRNTKHQHYNQVNLGLESLGRVWDGRINGYLPVGGKQSPYYHTKFKEFKGHSMYLRSSREFAFKGINAEAGFHLDHFKKAPLYFAAGPYYLTGKGASAWGGQLRASVDLFHRYLRLEANTSYDSFFKWIGQGQISLNYSFGKKIKKRDCNRPSVYERAVQRVDRFEIIPVGKDYVETEAINPITQQPYYFAFVDNTSHSLGTFESPYSTLADAEGNTSASQVIYVFPGDGTSTNMDSGITLQDSQMLFGASTVHPMVTTLGKVTIPAFGSNLPILTNTTQSLPVVTLANNNVVSGFYIENTASNSSGIQGTDIIDFSASLNTIIGGGGGGAGIFLTDVSGEIVVNDNLFVQTDGAGANYAVNIVSTTAECNASFINDTFYITAISPYGVNGINIDLSGTSLIDSLAVKGCSILGSGTANPGYGISTSMNGASSINNLIISDTTVNNFAVGAELDLAGSGSIQNILVSNSMFSNNTASAGFTVDLLSSGSVGNLNLSNSTFTNNGTYGLVTIQELAGTGSINNLTVSNCNLSNNGGYGMSIELNGTGSITNMLVSGCSINSNTTGGSGGNGIRIDLLGTGGLGTVAVSDCIINHNDGSGALYLNMTGTGSIGDFTLSDSDIGNFNGGSGLLAYVVGAGSIGNLTLSNVVCNAIPNAYGVLAYLQGGSSGSIPKITISNCTFESAYNGGGVHIAPQGSGLISQVVIENTVIRNVSNGIYLNLASAPTGYVLPNIEISNCISNNNGYGIWTDVGSGTSITNLTISDSTFSNNSSSGIYFNDGSSAIGTIDNLIISNSTISNNANGIHANRSGGGGAINSFAVSGCAFSTNADLGINIPNTLAVSQFDVVDSAFTANSVGVNITPIGPIHSTISGNAFNINSTGGLILTPGPASSVVAITDNTFSGVLTPSNGYGVNITDNGPGASLCLALVGNTAYPVNLGAGNDPYLLTGTGFFSLTAESTQANNIGTISISGGPLGSCSQ